MVSRPKKPLAATAEMGQDEREDAQAPPEPGIVVVFAGGKPVCVPIGLEKGRLELGWRQWGAAAIFGGCLFLVSHGGLAWAQQEVPSGVAALLVGTIPLWFAVLAWLFFGERLGGRALVGLVLGFAGLALLLTGRPGTGLTLVYWNCLFMLGAAIVLMASARQMWRGALIQGAAPLLFVLLATL